MPNTLVYVDYPSSDPEAAGRFYGELFGWQANPAHDGRYQQLVPDEGLHLGIYADDSRIPDPQPPADVGRSRLQPRIYVKVDEPPQRVIDRAVALGATQLWEPGWWEEFRGHHAAFLDPWGNEIVIWYKGDPPTTD